MDKQLIGVVGLGLLGRGICAALLGRGMQVVGVSPTDAEIDIARGTIAEAIVEMVMHGASDAASDDWHIRFEGTTSFEALKPCGFVIESTTEDFAIKQQVLAAIEAVVGAQIPIASNTSAIPIARLQEGRQNPSRILGMHWAEPAYATRFSELIRGAQTSDETFAAAAALAQACGKHVCEIQRDVPGFVANRLGYAIIREAIHLMETGVADAETIDRSFKNSVGLWAGFCGPLRWIDLTGGPALYAKAMAHVLPTLTDNPHTSATMSELAETAPDGMKGGAGFFRYTPQEAHDWEARFRKHAWNHFHQQSAHKSSEASS